MKYLLDNRYAPTTFSWGFIEATLEDTMRAFTSWYHRISASQGVQHDFLHCSGELSDLLLKLFPVTAPQSREMLTETRSSWTAYFDNLMDGGDPTSTVSTICNLMRCRGVAVCCTPHREPQDGVGVYGGVQFQLYAPYKTHFLNHLRTVCAVHDGTSRWLFEANGPVQPYEEPLQYGAHRVRDRFTPEMLERYCAALGIELFNPSFYGPKAVLIVNHGPFVCEPVNYSREEAARKLGLND